MISPTRIGLETAWLLKFLWALAPKELTIPRMSTTASPPELILFYATWCSYCVQFKPEWDKARAQLQPFLDRNELIIRQVESANLTPALGTYADVASYPSLRWLPSGREDAVAIPVEVGRRRPQTAAELVTWVQTSLSSA